MTLRDRFLIAKSIPKSRYHSFRLPPTIAHLAGRVEWRAPIYHVYLPISSTSPEMHCVNDTMTQGNGCPIASIHPSIRRIDSSSEYSPALLVHYKLSGAGPIPSSFPPRLHQSITILLFAHNETHD